MSHTPKQRHFQCAALLVQFLSNLTATCVVYAHTHTQIQLIYAAIKTIQRSYYFIPHNYKHAVDVDVVNMLFVIVWNEIIRSLNCFFIGAYLLNLCVCVSIYMLASFLPAISYHTVCCVNNTPLFSIHIHKKNLGITHNCQ